MARTRDPEHPPSPVALTEKQQVIHWMVAHYYHATGEPCSISYLARRLEKSIPTVRVHLDAIMKKGFATAETPAYKIVFSRSKVKP